MSPEVRDAAIRDIGCIACHLWGAGKTPCEKHHLNAFDMPGGKRRGERFTVGLCSWHHTGRCWHNGFPIERGCEVCKADRGPSWRWHKREFLDTFGDGDTLLAEQGRRIALWARDTLGLAA